MIDWSSGDYTNIENNLFYIPDIEGGVYLNSSTDLNEHLCYKCNGTSENTEVPAVSTESEESFKIFDSRRSKTMTPIQTKDSRITSNIRDYIYGRSATGMYMKQLNEENRLLREAIRLNNSSSNSSGSPSISIPSISIPSISSVSPTGYIKLNNSPSSLSSSGLVGPNSSSLSSIEHLNMPDKYMLKNIYNKEKFNGTLLNFTDNTVKFIFIVVLLFIIYIELRISNIYKKLKHRSYKYNK